MNENQIYDEPFVDYLHEKVKQRISRLLEDEALNAYKMKVAKHREEISDLQVKAEKQRQLDARRKELEKQRKENPMRENDKAEAPETPDYLRGSAVDSKGLPLRMKIDSERRLDKPYESAKKFKLGWNRLQGVVIIPQD